MPLNDSKTAQSIESFLNNFFSENLALRTFTSRKGKKLFYSDSQIFINYIMSSLANSYFRNDQNVLTENELKNRQKSLTTIFDTISENIDFVRLNEAMQSTGDTSLWAAFVNFKFGAEYAKRPIPTQEFRDLRIEDKGTLGVLLWALLEPTNPDVVKDIWSSIDSEFYAPAIPDEISYNPYVPQGQWLYEGSLYPIIADEKLNDALVFKN